MSQLVLIPIVFSIFLVPIIPEGFAGTRTHSVSASQVEDLGFLTIDADYKLNFRVNAPDEIQAGQSGTIYLTPMSTEVSTSILFGGERLGPYPSNVVLGSPFQLGIPGGYGLAVFLDTTAYARPSVTGPASLSSSGLSFNSMTGKEFRIYVSENIGSSNSINVKIPITIYNEIGAEMNLVLFSEKIASTNVQLNGYPTISVNIPLKKYYDTRLSIQVADGTQSGYIKVKPSLTYDNGRSLYESVSIKVDGVHKATAKANQWSGNIYAGTGYHNIQAEFSEKRSSSNSAIIYESSYSGVTNYNVKSTSSSSGSTTSSSSSTSRSTSLPSFPDYMLFVILGVGGAGAAAAGIIVKTKKKTKSSVEIPTGSGTILSEESIPKDDLVEKLAKDEITKEEYLDKIGYSKKEAQPQEEKKTKTKKEKKPKKEAKPKKEKKPKKEEKELTEYEKYEKRYQESLESKKSKKSSKIGRFKRKPKEKK